MQQETKCEIEKKSDYQGGRRRFTVNDDFFEQQSEKNCYWAGLLAADGNIDKRESRRISISLNTNDKYVLEKMAKDIGYSGSVKDYQVEKDLGNGLKKYYYSSFSFSSLKMADDLWRNFNIGPCKSRTLEFPEFSSNLCKDLFMKGFIDGDGSMSLNDGKNQCYFSILCGSFNFLNKFRERLQEIAGVVIPICKDRNNHRIGLSKKRARKVIAHFFKLSEPIMRRKWTDELKDHCFNFRVRGRSEWKCQEILHLLKNGNNYSQIAKHFSVSVAAISAFVNNSPRKEIFTEEINKNKQERVVFPDPEARRQKDKKSLRLIDKSDLLKLTKNQILKNIENLTYNGFLKIKHRGVDNDHSENRVVRGEYAVKISDYLSVLKIMLFEDVWFLEENKDKILKLESKLVD